MKFSYIVFILCSMSFLAISSFGQTNTSQPLQPITLNHIAVYVHNLNQATSFYENILQLNKIPEPFKDGLHTWFSIGPAGQLHLIQGEAKGIKINKNNHLCFSVSSLDTFIHNLEKRKINYESWKGEASTPTIRVDGVKQIYFQDPDGHWIEVNDDYPR